MLRKVMIGVNIALENIHSEADIYVNEIPQNFKEPCFCLQVLNNDEKQRLGENYLRTYNFCVQYHSENKDIFEIGEIAEKLNDSLECIKIGEDDYVRGVNRRYEVIEGVLFYFVTYKVHIRKTEIDDNIMENMTANIRTGGK